MKFLRAVRLDDSDDQVFPASVPAGEPVVAGSFIWEFSDADPADFHGKRLNAFRSGFLGTSGFGFCTLAAVGEISELEYKQLVERLAQYLVDHYGAPNLAAALPRARAEAEFTAGLSDRDPNHLVALQRELVLGEISESYRSIDPGQAWQRGSTPVFSIVADDTDQEDPSR